jgi:hypothetical protein
MTHTPYTQKRSHQWRGPSSSEDYNLRLEENYKDLAVVYNELNETQANHEETTSFFHKQLLSIEDYIDELTIRLAALEAEATGTISIIDSSQIDTTEFDSTAFEVTEECTYHNKYHFFTLPYVPASSVSKIKFKDQDDVVTTSANLEMQVSSISPSDDNNTAIVETSQPVYAVADQVGRIWQRNVIVPSTTANGAQMYLYIRIPADLTVTPYTNAILLDAFPAYGVEITEISYSTDAKVNLNSSATWTPLNDTVNYYLINEAIGFMPPGSWAGDEIQAAGPKAFYFPQKAITAVRIGLKRTEYYIDGTDFIYSYGLSNLDIRYDKFTDSGSTIIRFDAPDGDTISSVDSIQPHIWNVPEYLIDECFSYQVIWETSFNSGIYTTTPVALSQRVWIKVTLNKGPNGDQLPALSNMIVSYS